ncbi:MAG: glycine--tRNA ligase [Chitinophagales bacterium]|nr:glycine--tRNA ligase [Chitinophagales bacterium]MDW8419083.1 glycine--tRNA ligase [Chitinophagales bacterium]
MSKEQSQQLFQEIISHCKEYGFIFPSSEIYDGLSAVYDYGPYGAELKKNIQDYWWRAMVQLHENIVGIDAAIFMHPKTWKASGHVDAFMDPLIDNKDSKKRYRADVLIEDALAKMEEKIEKEVEKGQKKFGDAFDRDKFLATNPNVLRIKEKINAYQERFKKALDENNLAELKQIIVDLEIACEVSGSKNWTDVRQFNLMFSTEVGSVADEASTIYLRPETAQGIFVNFLQVQRTARQKIPFGIAQVGKAFRNEIVARQFIFRTREFEQMEMQFFVRPGTEMEWYEYWKQERMKWHRSLGFSPERLQYFDHIKLAHYANAAVDIQYQFPFGFKEIEGIHSRTDYDLKNHQELSGKKLQYFDPDTNESYIPYVVETSVGLNRTFLAVICNAYRTELLDDGSERVVLSLPPFLAPVQIAVFPLVKKDGLPEKAKEIFSELRWDLRVFYEEKDSIGKRYRRQDAIGTPYCITIDHQTLTDNTVTLRDRDTMKQERISIDRLKTIVADKVDWKKGLQ